MAFFPGESPEDHPPAPEGQVDDQQVFTLVRHLFGQFVAHLSEKQPEFTTADVRKIRVSQFYHWLHRAQLNELGETISKLRYATGQQQAVEDIARESDYLIEGGPQLDELLHTLKIGVEACRMAYLMLSDPFKCCQLLHPWWPMLVLYGTPPLQHKIETIELIVQITWQDGKFFNVVSRATYEPAKPGTTPFTEGSVATLIRNAGLQTADRLGQLGMDAVHEQLARRLPAELGAAVDDPQAGGQTEQQIAQPPTKRLWVPGS